MKFEITFYDQYYNEDSTVVKEYKNVDELLDQYGFTYWRDTDNGKYLNMYNNAKFHLLNEEIVHSSENGCGRKGDFGYPLENDSIMKVKILNDDIKEIKELLQILLDNIDKLKSGLCLLNESLYFDKTFTSNDCMLIREYLRNNKVLDNNLWFPHGEKQPRIEWLKSQIEKIKI